jgi:hypothetical protein
MSLSDVDGHYCLGKLHRRLAVDEDQAVQQPLKKVIGILLRLIAAKMIFDLFK